MPGNGSARKPLEIQKRERSKGDNWLLLFEKNRREATCSSIIDIEWDWFCAGFEDLISMNKMIEVWFTN